MNFPKLHITKTDIELNMHIQEPIQTIRQPKAKQTIKQPNGKLDIEKYLEYIDKNYLRYFSISNFPYRYI